MKRTLAIALVLVFGACGGGGSEEADSAPETEPTTSSPTIAADPQQVATLQEGARVSYEAAATYAATHDNYFARNTKQQGELAATISTRLAQEGTGFGSQYVDEEDLDLCSFYEDKNPMIRIWSSEDGRDIVLASSDHEIVLTLTYTAGQPEPVYGDPEECEPLG